MSFCRLKGQLTDWHFLLLPTCCLGWAFFSTSRSANKPQPRPNRRTPLAAEARPPIELLTTRGAQWQRLVDDRRRWRRLGLLGGLVGLQLAVRGGKRGLGLHHQSGLGRERL